ncbi:serine hydrolase domain-containing protein [Phytohabitans sp. LJ34]|uniref:serine hydrolase domain-containing protein n=1 Tax=Phytohabitans sp. LJ34 TaxID=3452217 RepID=UPI003F8B6965
MKKTFLPALAVAAVLATTTGASTAAAGPVTDPVRERLDRDVRAITALGVTGVQARLVTPGRTAVVTGGVADTGTGRPVSPDGYFRIGSATKTFVATVVLQLVGERRLSLDDSVERWLPGLVRGNGNDGSRMTIRHLLQHTSGIHDDYPYFESAEDYYQHRFDVHTPEQIVAAAMAHRPDFAPGTAWGYSNTGYVLLGMVIEKVTGQPWHRQVRKRVIGPLGLRHTFWPGTRPDLPRPHANGYQQYEPGGPLVDVTLLVDADASGGLLSTTADLNTFFRALLGGRLLKPAELALMKQTRPVDEQLASLWPGARYGLGIFEIPLPCGGTYWTHNGSQEGFVTDNGVTGDGRHSIAASMSTALAFGAPPPDDSPALRQAMAATALIQNALCEVTAR